MSGRSVKRVTVVQEANGNYRVAFADADGKILAARPEIFDNEHDAKLVMFELVAFIDTHVRMRDLAGKILVAETEAFLAQKNGESGT